MKTSLIYKMAEMAYGPQNQYESTIWLRLLTLYILKLTTIFSAIVLIATIITSGQNYDSIFIANCVYVVMSILVLSTFRFYKNITWYSIIFLTVETIYPFMLHFLGNGFLLSQGDFLWIIVAIITVILMFDVKFASFYFSLIVVAIVILAALDIYRKDYGLIFMTLPKLIKVIFNTGGLITCVFVPLSVFWPQMLKAFRQSQDLLYKVEETNGELNDTLDELKATQSLLVQSEKMASLGQLIAGIAHEINTPLGAIKASATIINNSLRKNLIKLMGEFRALSNGEVELVFYMIDKGLLDTVPHTTSEIRKYKRAMHQYLESQRIADSQDVAGLLIEMNILEIDVVKPLLHCLSTPDGNRLIDIAYQFIVMARGTSNILAASDRVVKIIFALKSFSHNDSTGSAVLSNILEGIEVVLTLYYNQIKCGINIIKEYEDIPLILAYPDELNQVWTNMIHNSIQAMNGNGTLKITVKRNDSFVMIGFTDTGCGIPEENMSKIFQPFFTTKSRGEGSGLGLDISNNIIKKHGGSIEVVSVVGEGTTFTVSLPIRTELTGQRK